MTTRRIITLIITIVLLASLAVGAVAGTRLALQVRDQDQVTEPDCDQDRDRLHQQDQVTEPDRDQDRDRLRDCDLATGTDATPATEGQHVQVQTRTQVQTQTQAEVQERTEVQERQQEREQEQLQEP